MLNYIMGGIALVPLLAYLLHWLFYSRSPYVRVGGEQSGDPIRIPERGTVFSAVSTRSRHSFLLSEVWVSFSPDEVDLSKTKGAEQRITTDDTFPLALLFSEKRMIVKSHLQGNHFEYEAKGPDFAVKFIAKSEIEATALPFLLNMFPARRMQRERICRFKVVQGYAANLQRDGLGVAPRESLHLEGVQSQREMRASASEGLRVIEVIDDKKSQ